MSGLRRSRSDVITAAALRSSLDATRCGKREFHTHRLLGGSSCPDHGHSGRSRRMVRIVMEDPMNAPELVPLQSESRLVTRGRTDMTPTTKHFDLDWAAQVGASI